MIVDCGIDAHEPLLFMSEDQISKLPGVGPVSMKEIVATGSGSFPHPREDASDRIPNLTLKQDKLR
jgi:hypothetical protein